MLNAAWDVLCALQVKRLESAPIIKWRTKERENGKSVRSIIK
jgi:hypothetical protein